MLEDTAHAVGTPIFSQVGPQSLLEAQVTFQFGEAFKRNRDATGLARGASTRVARIFLGLVVVLGWFVSGARGQANVNGQWSVSSYTMPINPVHAALLKNGKILIMAGSGNCPPSQSGCPSGAPYGPPNGSGALLLDPSSGGITQFTLPWDMFCNSMTVLADGRVFINGGTIQYDPFYGQPKSSIFDPSSHTFTDVEDMAHGRWYPTVITLGDGRIMTWSGTNESGITNTAVEIYTVGTGWSTQYSAPFTPPLYPRLHLLPNGRVFYSGWGRASALFDAPTTTWTQNVATTNYGNMRTYGSSVMLALTPANGYDPKIMILGGSSPATATTEIIDMGASSPAWVYGPLMSQPRIEMNSVLLPTGQVLAVGGSTNDEDTGSLSLNADLYTPGTSGTGSFSSAGTNATERLYHSIALLLPDATVWLAGGNPNRGTYNATVEIYQPPYLFQSSGALATRPSITSTSSSISYGNGFTVQTPDAANISSVVLVKNGSVTHGFNMDQRLVGMSFAAASGSLTVTAPPNSNIAPPGYYMLFLLNSSGVPSVASMVNLSGPSTAPAPTVTSISPGSGSVSGGTAVTIKGTNFVSGATVSFGGTAATGVAVASSTSIAATTPAHAAGAVTVKVTNADSQSGSLASGYTYTSPAPTVKAVTPATGTTSGGTRVTITGTNFVSGATANFGGTAATGVTVASSTSITATTPAHAAGATTVTVTNTDSQGGSLVSGYTYVAGANPAPTVKTVTPATGSTSGGTGVTITGTNFVSGATVSFGGTAATGVTVASGTTITATTAAHAAGAVTVTVTNSDSQSGSLAGGYSYTAGANPAPSVLAITPTAGSTSGGNGMIITGANLMSGATVSFGGTAATGVTVVSGTSITATTPAHAAGAVAVAVTNPDGQSGSLASGYTYAGNSGTPSLGLGVASGGSASATVVAGQTASYAVSIGGKGESGTASLSCAGAPAGATCSLPASETLSATVPQTFSVSVATASRTVGELHPPISAPVPWLWAVAVLGIIGWPGTRRPRRSTGRYFWLAPLLLLSFLVSCGGGGSGTPTTPSAKGTPAGTYTLTVTATSPSAAETTSLTLTVQ